MIIELWVACYGNITFFWHLSERGTGRDLVDLSPWPKIFVHNMVFCKYSYCVYKSLSNMFLKWHQRICVFRRSRSLDGEHPVRDRRRRWHFVFYMFMFRVEILSWNSLEKLDFSGFCKWLFPGLVPMATCAAAVNLRRWWIKVKNKDKESVKNENKRILLCLDQTAKLEQL